VKEQFNPIGEGDYITTGRLNKLGDLAERADNDAYGGSAYRISNGALRGGDSPTAPAVFPVRMTVDCVPDNYSVASASVNVVGMPNAVAQTWDDVSHDYVDVGGNDLVVTPAYGLPLRAGDLVFVQYTGGKYVPFRQPETETLTVTAANPSSAAIVGVDTSNPPTVSINGNHGLVAGQIVVVSGTGTVDGTWQVLTAPPGNTLTINAPQPSSPAAAGTLVVASLDAKATGFSSDTLAWSDGAAAWMLLPNPTGPVLGSGRYPGRLTGYVGGRPLYTLAGVVPAPLPPQNTTGFGPWDLYQDVLGTYVAGVVKGCIPTTGTLQPNTIYLVPQYTSGTIGFNGQLGACGLNVISAPAGATMRLSKYYREFRPFGPNPDLLPGRKQLDFVVNGFPGPAADIPLSPGPVLSATPTAQENSGIGFTSWWALVVNKPVVVSMLQGTDLFGALGFPAVPGQQFGPSIPSFAASGVALSVPFPYGPLPDPCPLTGRVTLFATNLVPLIFYQFAQGGFG
jgi:hypothetical protein